MRYEAQGRCSSHTLVARLRAMTPPPLAGRRILHVARSSLQHVPTDTRAELKTTRARSWAAVARVFVVLAAGKLLFEAYIARQQDFLVYVDAARRLIDGGQLYGPLNALPFTYPPITAALFVPFAWMPNVFAVLLWCVINLGLAAWVLRRLIPAGPRLLLVLLALGAPFARSVYLGQVNLVLFSLLVSAATAATVSRWSGWRVGVAATVKITPGWLGLVYLVTGRWRPLAVMAAAAVTGIGLGWVLRPQDSQWYWTHGVWNTNRVGGGNYPDNQSVWGLIARISPDTPTALPATACILIIAASLYAARRHRTSILEVFTSVGLAGLLIAPVSWSHHFIWLSVMVVLLYRRRHHRAAYALATCLAIEPVFMNGIVHALPTPLAAIGSSHYTLLALTSLVYLNRISASPATHDDQP